MSEIIVKVEHLSKSFTDDAGTFSVLKDTSFTVNRGEMVALVGVSGAGKTTLLQILGGLDRFECGEVDVCGAIIKTLSPKKMAEFRNRHIGFVFQFHHLLPDLSAIENAIIPGLIAGKSREACIKRALELFDEFGLVPRKSHFPTELSGGERQRVALARALLNDPSLILADEPTGNLDKKNGEILLEYFKKANKDLNQTFIIATHNTHLTDSMNRTLFIEDGGISGEGLNRSTVTE
jgi:lipoprotein-releasing system ATP-binding protein